MKNELVTALKDSHQEFMKFGSHVNLILKTDSGDIRIGVMKNNIKTEEGTFVCEKDLEQLLSR